MPGPADVLLELVERRDAQLPLDVGEPPLFGRQHLGQRLDLVLHLHRTHEHTASTSTLRELLFPPAHVTFSRPLPHLNQLLLQLHPLLLRQGRRDEGGTDGRGRVLSHLSHGVMVLLGTWERQRSNVRLWSATLEAGRS